MYNKNIVIQWFPGHMKKALNEIKKKQSIANLFIVVLDSRAPLSSYNAQFDDIAPSKPRLFVITKKDYADERKLSNIVNYYKNDIDDCVVVNLKNKSSSKKIMQKIEQMIRKKNNIDVNKTRILKSKLIAFVVGVPNAGKSTLINVLANKASTKVGNMPGITKGEQWINAGKIQLMDTPGILWPKFDDTLTGAKLAIIGSIKTKIIPKQELIYAGYRLLTKYYPTKIEELGLEPAIEESNIYSQIINLCKIKKFKIVGNKYDLQKAQDFFIKYLRDLKGVTYD